MDDKFLVNQRVRELMEVLNFPENVDGFYKKYLGEGSSERLRLVYIDRHPIKIEFLLEIAKNIAKKTGKKVNGHWLLMGEGGRFLDENITQDNKITEIENKLSVIDGKVNALIEHKEKGESEVKKNPPFIKS